MSRHQCIWNPMVLPLIILGFCWTSSFSIAADKLSPSCLDSADSNIEQCANDVYQIVADKMGIVIEDTVPKPTILTGGQITLEKFNTYLGWDSVAVLPYYFSRHNTVMIPKGAGLDSLAHELVHYFQVMYRNDNFGYNFGPYIDGLEMEAVSIQKWFENNYLDSNYTEYELDGEFVKKISSNR